MAAWTLDFRVTLGVIIQCCCYFVAHFPTFWYRKLLHFDDCVLPTSDRCTLRETVENTLPLFFTGIQVMKDQEWCGTFPTQAGRQWPWQVCNVGSQIGSWNRKKKKKGIKKMVFGPLGGSVERLISWGWPLYFACSLVINSIAPKLIS